MGQAARGNRTDQRGKSGRELPTVERNVRLVVLFPLQVCLAGTFKELELRMLDYQLENIGDSFANGSNVSL